MYVLCNALVVYILYSRVKALIRINFEVHIRGKNLTRLIKLRLKDFWVGKEQLHLDTSEGCRLGA